MTVEEYFRELQEELRFTQVQNNQFIETEFTVTMLKELEDSGAIGGGQLCYWRDPRDEMRVDAYWFVDDEPVLNLFVVDYQSRMDLERLHLADVGAAFERLKRFFDKSTVTAMYRNLEPAAPGYGLAEELYRRASQFKNVNFFLISERELHEEDAGRFRTEEKDGERTFTYNVWDISRFHRMLASDGAREKLEIDFNEMFGTEIQCLPANIGTDEYQSFLIAFPGNILADLYSKFGDRLLEQNVRSFLQARVKVNKGIQNTIRAEPEMFFAYNNGITATAIDLKVEKRNSGIFISKISDLQIVNGGQTTASLFHARRRDKNCLEKIFVQMKLSKIDRNLSEVVVPKISEYANTQNKVNAADFFANHPFHVKIEQFSRNIRPPAHKPLWYYERMRGQYANEIGKETPARQREFKNKFPKSQLISKTDLAKFMAVWLENPWQVQFGAQKNFSKFAERVGKDWKKNEHSVNELYFRQLIARAILFKWLEKQIPKQQWFTGGYRANTVAYTLSIMSEICRRKKRVFDFEAVWSEQSVPNDMEKALLNLASFVYSQITSPPRPGENISEWCKKEACWDHLVRNITTAEATLDRNFLNSLRDPAQVAAERIDAEDIQVIDDGIRAQRTVVEFGPQRWARFLKEGVEARLFSQKDISFINVAISMNNRLPSEKQCKVLMEIVERAARAGLDIHGF